MHLVSALVPALWFYFKPIALPRSPCMFSSRCHATLHLPLTFCVGWGNTSSVWTGAGVDLYRHVLVLPHLNPRQFWCLTQVDRNPSSPGDSAKTHCAKLPRRWASYTRWVRSSVSQSQRHSLAGPDGVLQCVFLVQIGRALS